ncbi:MAG TPA: DUF2793 domain-containing protein [Paenirhodobacter sp.]
MSDSSPRLSLPFILPSQAQKHVTHNESLEILDVLVQLAVLDQALTAPPAVLTEGDRFIVAAGAGGAWAGRDNNVAAYGGETQGWRFFAPRRGWRAYVIASGADVIWTGTAWAVIGGGASSLTTLPLLGISATADATNRLSVAAAATLLSHAGAGHQLKINKAGTTDTASLLFQSGWSGRAEMGLTGTDDFTIKVSADGTTFQNALRFDKATGLVSGTAVQSAAVDATAGRLLRVGAFGLGGSAPIAGNISATDSTLAPGFYGYDTAGGSTGGPADVTSGIVLHQRRGSTSAAQVLIDAAGVIHSRAQTATGWGIWRQAGTQSGETVQGRYRREADGTQTCWQSVTTTTAGDTSVSFPAAFASDAGLITTLGVTSTTDGVITARITGRTASGLSVSAFNASGARVAVTVDLVTNGRAA